MRQKYIVYLKGKALFFNNSYTHGAFSVRGTGLKALNEAIEALSFSNHVSLPDIHPETGIELLKAQYPLITASGGVIQSEFNKILLIYRLENWDLPKGKVDEGETTAAAAQREINEETGIMPGPPLGLLCRSWHSYLIGNQEVLKETYWYHFKVSGEPEPVLQTEEYITDSAWFYPQEALALQSKMYPSVRDVISSYQTLSSNKGTN